MGREAVKGTGLDKRLDLPLVQVAARLPVQEIVKRTVFPAAVPLTECGTQHTLADVSERKQSVADTATVPVGHGVKIHLTFIDIRRQNADTVPGGFRSILRHFGLIAQHRSQKRRKVGTGIVRL